MGESIDIVVVSNNVSPTLWAMTHNALRTATEYAGMEVGQCITIEQSRTAQPQKIGKTIRYGFEFNYNRCLNLGFSISRSKYIAFCNNDLLFERNWAVNVVNAMKAGNYLSACPSGRHQFAGVREGYKVGVHITGWCIICDRDLFDIIGKFDEVVSFWYSDNVYAVQLICAGVKHALVGNSRVKHFKSKTLSKISEDRDARTKGQKEIFINYKKEKYDLAGIEM